MQLLFQTGLRSVELTKIRLGDIDFGKREIHITSAKASAGDENYIRYVYYHKNLDHLMREWINKQRQSYGPAANSDYLFLTDQGSKMRPSYISRIMKEQVKRLASTNQSPKLRTGMRDGS